MVLGHVVCQVQTGVNDAIIYLMHCPYSNLDKPGDTVRIIFFLFLAHLQYHPASPA